MQRGIKSVRFGNIKMQFLKLLSENQINAINSLVLFPFLQPGYYSNNTSPVKEKRFQGVV